MPEQKGQSDPNRGGQTQGGAEGTQEDSLAEFGEKYKGKTAAEVAKMHQELEKKLGEKDHELKEKEQNLMAYENWYRQVQSQGQQQSQGYGSQQATPPPDNSSTGESFWDNPEVASQRVAKSMLGQYDQQRSYRDAISRAPMVEQLAKQQYPQVFEGLAGGEVRNILMQGVNNGTIHPDVMQDPRGWARAAALIKSEKSNFQVSTKKQEPTGSGTEIPEQIKQQPYGETNSVRFDSHGRELMDKFGFSEKDATEIVRKERKEREEMNK